MKMKHFINLTFFSFIQLILVTGLLMIVFIQNRNIAIYNLQESDQDPRIEQCPEQVNEVKPNQNNQLLDENKLKSLLSSFVKSGREQDAIIRIN